MPVPPASGLHKSVRDALPVRLGDRKYNIDVTRLVRSTIDPIRQGFDTQGQPGEQSLNQAGVWKRRGTIGSWVPVSVKRTHLSRRYAGSIPALVSTLG